VAAGQDDPDARLAERLQDVAQVVHGPGQPGRVSDDQDFAAFDSDAESRPDGAVDERRRAAAPLLEDPLDLVALLLADPDDGLPLPFERPVDFGAGGDGRVSDSVPQSLARRDRPPGFGARSPWPGGRGREGV
jgi:hypothetical protein